MLKRKITETINAKVDPESMLLQLDCTKPENFEAAPCKTRSLAVLDEAQRMEIDEVISDQRKEENLRYLREGVPYFKDFDDDEFYELMDKVSVLQTETMLPVVVCFLLSLVIVSYTFNVSIFQGKTRNV